MGKTTPNMGIYIPAAGEQLYGDSFSAGMTNIDAHDHTGGPNKGVPLGSTSLASGSVTYDKLNANVVDTSTGLAVSATLPNQLQTAGILKNIYQLATTNGFIGKNGSTAVARTLTGTSNQVAVTNGDSTVGDPVFSLSPTVTLNTQPGFSAHASTVNTVTGDGTIYTVIFNNMDWRQPSASTDYNAATGVFTAPSTGIYLFTTTIHVSGVTTNVNDFQLIINATSITSNTLWEGSPFTITYSTGNFNLNGSQIVSMTAGDTASISIKGAGTTKVINLIGGYFTCMKLW